MVSIAVNPRKVAQAEEGLRRVVASFLEEGISEGELALEKRHFLGSQVVRLQTNDGLAQTLHDALFYDLGKDYLDNLPRRIQGITKKEVDRAIRKRLHTKEIYTVVAGPVKP